MRELKDEQLKSKTHILYSNLIKLKKLDIDNYYCSNLINWFNEVILKNIAIYKSKQDKAQMDQELYKKKRQHVYWIDFGRNIGSEFMDFHFAVVIHESKYTALVVPLTSKKDYNPTWIEENKDVIVDLGVIDDFPEELKECYACTFMLHSVSKKRLSKYGDNVKGYFDIKLSDSQMDEICSKISHIAYNTI